MKLKFFRIALISCLLITALFTGGAVYADSNDSEASTDLGITPDSPFYFLDKWGKGLGMFFTFGDEAKAKKALKYGEERLAEAEYMANKNRIRETEQAAEDYAGYMAMVNERVQNAGTSDNLTETVCVAAARHLAIMERIRERVQERAGDAIDNAENATMNGQLNALRALAKNKIQRAAELTSNAVENNLNRVRARTCDNVTAENGISGNCTADMELLLGYIDRLEGLEDELIAKAEELGIDVTPLLERLAQSTQNRIQVLSQVMQNAPENARNGIQNAIQNTERKYEQAMERLRVRENWTDDTTVTDNSTGNNGRNPDNKNEIAPDNGNGNKDHVNNGDEPGRNDKENNGRNGN